jgi:hypothetical protein
MPVSATGSAGSRRVSTFPLWRWRRGAVPACQITRAGVGSTVPAAFTARAAKACKPAVREGSVNVLAHNRHGEPSRLHWNVEPASEEASVKLEISCEGPRSCEKIVVFGAGAGGFGVG